jgi:hypothetical protein
MSVGELGRALGLGEFEVTKVLFQLVQSKHVTMQRAAPARRADRGGRDGQPGAAGDPPGGRHGRQGHDPPHRSGELRRRHLRGGVPDAGPFEKGTLDVQRVVDNARMLAAGPTSRSS